MIKRVKHWHFACTDCKKSTNNVPWYLELQLAIMNGKSKFIDVLEYINIAEYEQKKGKCGDVK